jgi:hypothetical protein
MSESQPPSSGGVVVATETGHVYITPVGFWVRAKEFLEAGELLSTNAGRVTPVSAFLFCRASELALKSFLLARGSDIDGVRGIGHDLAEALGEAYARGIDTVVALTTVDNSVLRAMNAHYLGHRLAYFDLSVLEAPMKGPQFDSLPEIARKLVDGVRRGCLDAADGNWKPF